MTELRKLLFSLPGKLASSIAGRGLSKLPFAMWIHHFFFQHFSPKGTILADVQGSKMYIDSFDTGVAPFLLEWGIYEKYVTQIFKKLIKKGAVVVDVGANIGYYTLLAAQLAGEEGRVFAFEPDPHNYNLLCKNIQLNGYNNVIAVHKAVSSKSGKTRLFLDKRNLGAHSLIETNVEKQCSIAIEATSLNDYFKDMSFKIDVVKMDVQGAEMSVLEGMSNMINETPKLEIITEFWPAGLLNSGTSPKHFLERLVADGFVIYQIGPTIKPAEIAQLLSIRNGEDLATLLCRKRTKA